MVCSEEVNMRVNYRCHLEFNLSVSSSGCMEVRFVVSWGGGRTELIVKFVCSKFIGVGGTHERRVSSLTSS